MRPDRWAGGRLALRLAAATFLVIGLVVAVAVATQRDVDTPELKPYPGAVELCHGDVIGGPDASGRPGPHILWTTYYSVEPQKKVVAYYQKVLGTRNHSQENSDDVWRFPQDKPRYVLSVTRAPGPQLSNSCKKAPATALTVIVISSSSRPLRG
jgi:hypothetical protein